ncbi:MAG: DUF4157 domain-containing protein [Myxococcota bacterium]
MASNSRKAPGEGISDRLSARASTGLVSRRMADGGEVYSGPLARQALRSVGARAMTVEGGDIVVDSSFDASRPEDAALYAHERVHQLGSGGAGGGAAGHNDGEEQAARAIEGMVLHRMEQGDSLSDVLHDVSLSSVASLARNALGASDNPLGQLVERSIDSAFKSESSMHAYWIEMAKGKPHREVVDDLARWVVAQLENADEETRFRQG